MQFKKINEGTDRKFRPGPKMRTQYKINTDPLARDKFDRNHDRFAKLDSLKKIYFQNAFAKVAESFDDNIKYDDINSPIIYKVDINIKNLSLIHSLINNLSNKSRVYITTGFDDEEYVIALFDKYMVRTISNPTISLEEFKKITDEYANEILNTIKKINSIITSNAKIHFNTEAFKERLNKSIGLVKESNDIESKIASKKNGKEAYKEYLELQEVFRNYAGKFLDLLGVDNSVSKILLKTQIDLGTAFTSEFPDTPPTKDKSKPEVPPVAPIK
jgi:hypothetical protein